MLDKFKVYYVVIWLISFEKKVLPNISRWSNGLVKCLFKISFFCCTALLLLFVCLVLRYPRDDIRWWYFIFLVRQLTKYKLLGRNLCHNTCFIIICIMWHSGGNRYKMYRNITELQISTRNLHLLITLIAWQNQLIYMIFYVFYI